MINIHLTKKLFEKLPLDDDGFLPEFSDVGLQNENVDLLGEWTAHVLTIERRQCLLFVHHETRFPIFIPAVRKPDMTRLESLFEDIFLNTLLKLGVSQQTFERAGNAVSRLKFDSKTNKSVLAHITQYKRQLEFICEHYDMDQTTGYSISRSLAQGIVGAKGQEGGYMCPASEMALLLGENAEAAHELGLHGLESNMSTDDFNDEHYLILSRYLTDYASDDEVTNVPELHGFLTGVLLSPQMILPSVWLPAVWGGEKKSPIWASIDASVEFQTAAITLYNEIANQLEDIDRFEPMFAKYFQQPEREYSTPWCYGFFQGFIEGDQVSIFPTEVQVALSELSIPFDPQFADEFEADGDIIERHCEQTQTSLKIIHQYTRGTEQSIKAPLRSNVVPFVRDERTGRNEPCPCGSGKKFKKCCLH